MQCFGSELPGAIVILVFSFFAIQCLNRPDEEEGLPSGFVSEQISKLGPMSRSERVTMIVAAIAVFLWMTEMLHGISPTIVALVALCALLATTVFDRSDFRSGIPWAVAFIGAIVGISNLFPALNMDKWLVQLFGPYIAPITSNPYMFVGAMAIATHLIRFVSVSQTAAMTIFTVMLTPLAIQGGMNPWIAGIIILPSGNAWNVFYQNTTYVTAFCATRVKMVIHNQDDPTVRAIYANIISRVPSGYSSMANA